jgi:3-deoxy-D-manno-octulosonate 8-phosphate phosphatase (KDO 8-P phosphatase)
MDNMVKNKNGNGSKPTHQICLLLTDCDGVLTDSGVYYSAEGEALKRFSVRDGMGVERLRNLAGIDVGIITGEDSAIVKKRAEKLQITELHLGIKDKVAVLEEIMARRHLLPQQVAYIGDDTNDVGIMQQVGLSACPADAIHFVQEVADYVCAASGGYGAFREFADYLIETNGDYTVSAPAYTYKPSSRFTYHVSEW